MKLLEFNGIKFYAIEWEGKIGFLNTQLCKVLSLPYQDYITKRINKKDSIYLEDDSTILKHDKMAKFKNLMTRNGIEDILSRNSCTIIYTTGLLKFLNIYKNELTEKFKNYLLECNIFDEDDLIKYPSPLKENYKENSFKEFIFKNKICRVINYQDKMWAVFNDVCDILQIPRHLYGKISNNYINVIQAKVKTNAIKDIRIINLEGINSLMKYTIMTDDELNWFKDVLVQNNKMEQLEIDLYSSKNNTEKLFVNKSVGNETETKTFDSFDELQVTSKKCTSAYYAIESIGKTTLPDEIKFEYISSIMIKEGIIDNNTFLKAKQMMESAYQNNYPSK